MNEIEIEKKQKNSSNIYVGVTILHVIYAILFCLAHCYYLVAINIVAVGLYFHLAIAIRKTTSFARIYITCTVAMVLFLVSHYITLGPSWGFQYIGIGTIPLIYYASYFAEKGLKQSTLFAIASVVLFLLISLAGTAIHYPIFDINPIFNRVVIVMNILMAFYIAIASMSAYIDDTTKEANLLIDKNSNLEKSANIDVLTGLNNRRTIKKYMDSAFKRALGYGEEFTIFMCDIDNFKSVNDTYGHDCGDQVLKNIANIIKREIRIDDMVFRWGGEEFLILVNERKFAAKRIAEKCRTAVELSTVDYNGTTIKVTLTIGGATYYQGASYDDLVNRADENLYIGKNSGKNQVVI